MQESVCILAVSIMVMQYALENRVSGCFDAGRRMSAANPSDASTLIDNPLGLLFRGIVVPYWRKVCKGLLLYVVGVYHDIAAPPLSSLKLRFPTISLRSLPLKISYIRLGR